MKAIFQRLSDETADNYDRQSGKFRTINGIRLGAGRSSRGKRTVIALTLQVQQERLFEARNLQEQEDEWEEKNP